MATVDPLVWEIIAASSRAAFGMPKPDQDRGRQKTEIDMKLKSRVFDKTAWSSELESSVLL